MQLTEWAIQSVTAQRILNVNGCKQRDGPFNQSLHKQIKMFIFGKSKLFYGIQSIKFSKKMDCRYREECLVKKWRCKLWRWEINAELTYMRPVEIRKPRWTATLQHSVENASILMDFVDVTLSLCESIREY